MTASTTRILTSMIFTPRRWPPYVLTMFKVLSVIFGGVIIYASLMSVGPGASVPNLDKAMHALAYAALTGSLRLGWPVIWGGFIIIGAGALGVGLEFGQAMLAQGRVASLADAIANMFGVCIALALLWPFRKDD